MGQDEVRYSLRVKTLDVINSGLRIGLLITVDPSGIGETRELVLSTREGLIAKEFTVLVNTCVFGFGLSPVLSDCFVCLLLPDGNPDWVGMNEIIDEQFQNQLRSKDIQRPPFIVVQKTSGKMYAVTDIIHDRPSKFELSVNGWNKSVPESKSTLANFYKGMHNIDLDEDQPILVSYLGACIKPLPLFEPLQNVPQPSKKSSSSAIYLVPQTVKLHPITRIYALLLIYPRILYWADSGLLSKRVSSIIESPFNAVNYDLHEIFIPSNGNMLYESPLVTMTSVALTCPSASMGFNYRKLEWLGDAVLGLLVAQKGISNMLVRESVPSILSNEHIGARVAAMHPIIHTVSVLSRRPSIKLWSECRNRLNNFNILADIAEALIGAAFLCSGMEGALHAVQSLGILDHIHLATNFVFSPAVITSADIKLKATLRTLKLPHANLMDLGQWDSYRQKFITSDN